MKEGRVNRDKLRARPFVAVPMIAALTLLLMSPSVALASCNPGRTPHDNVARYDITAASPSSLTGISARILEYDPYYSGSNNTGTNATIMLVQWSPSELWAQLGWFKSKIRGGTVHRESGLEFCRPGGGCPFQWFSSKTVGTFTTYEIYYQAPDSFYFYISGNWVQTLHGSWTPSQYQVFGETHDYADQLPGGIWSHEEFSQTKYYTGAGYTPHTATAGISGSIGDYGHSIPQAGTYDIWDKQCTA